jgi:hypothetical protein
MMKYMLSAASLLSCGCMKGLAGVWGGRPAKPPRLRWLGVGRDEMNLHGQRDRTIEDGDVQEHGCKSIVSVRGRCDLSGGGKEGVEAAGAGSRQHQSDAELQHQQGRTQRTSRAA